MTLLVILLAFALAAVAASLGIWWWKRRVAPTVFEGSFTCGWETSVFVPDTSVNERYWLVWTPESGFEERLRRAGLQAGAGAHATGRIRFKGIAKSEGGSFGHNGQYAREVTVQRVLEIAPARKA